MRDELGITYIAKFMTKEQRIGFQIKQREYCEMSAHVHSFQIKQHSDVRTCAWYNGQIDTCHLLLLLFSRRIIWPIYGMNPTLLPTNMV